jgi:hypothetical protein
VNPATGKRSFHASVGLMLFHLLLLPSMLADAQPGYLSTLCAGKHFPIYTGYAAAKERSHFLLDEGYRFSYDTDSLGADFISGKAGDLGCAFRIGTRILYKTADFYRAPVITASFPDMVRYDFMPVRGLLVKAWFLVYSSDAAVWQLEIHNQTRHQLNAELYFFLHAFPKLLSDPSIAAMKHAILLKHNEPPDSWSRDHQIPYQTNIRDMLILSVQPDSGFWDNGNPAGYIGPNGYPWPNSADMAEKGFVTVAGLSKVLHLAPASVRTLRFVRSVTPAAIRGGNTKAFSLLHKSLQPFLVADEHQAARIPKPHFKDPDQTALYWSACNMMLQEMYPAEGKCKENYYVFSREPMWGWGHGGQVFHESLSMLEYVRLDPKGAMGSQEIFADRQHADGYINYRTGPYLDETIPANGSLTCSAPWYNWENWEIYSQTHSRKFLERMYPSGEKLFSWFVKNRDSDRDGLCEWGGDPVLECVRDGEVAVWDQVGPPSAFDSPDLNCMLVQEARSLERMARVLGKSADAARWRRDYTQRINLINEYCWDQQRGFYYNVTRETHSFSYRKTGDLLRDEIIGFLPLWAGVATREQASSLVRKLTDTASFWRLGGIPSLSASDPYFDPKGYWNGPVWVEWNYLIERGLLDYGYADLASELARRVSANMISVLKQNHELWEFYSPDTAWGGKHRTYIWAALVNRMMTDALHPKPQVN